MDGHGAAGAACIPPQKKTASYTVSQALCDLVGKHCVHFHGVSRSEDVSSDQASLSYLSCRSSKRRRRGGRQAKLSVFLFEELGE
eukprot:gene12238-biopygen18465